MAHSKPKWELKTILIYKDSKEKLHYVSNQAIYPCSFDNFLHMLCVKKVYSTYCWIPWNDGMISYGEALIENREYIKSQKQIDNIIDSLNSRSKSKKIFVIMKNNCIVGFDSIEKKYLKYLETKERIASEHFKPAKKKQPLPIPVFRKDPVPILFNVNTRSYTRGSGRKKYIHLLREDNYPMDTEALEEYGLRINKKKHKRKYFGEYSKNRSWKEQGRYCKQWDGRGNSIYSEKSFWKDIKREEDFVLEDEILESLE